MYLQLQVSACCWDDFNQEWFLQEPCWGIDVIFNVIIIDHCSIITQLTLKKMVRVLRHLSHTADLWKTGTLFRSKLFPSFLMTSVIYSGVPYAVCFLSVSQLYREVRIMKILNHPNIGEYLLTSSLHLCDRPELLRCHICNFPGVKQVRGRTSSHCCFISPSCFYQVVHTLFFFAAISLVSVSALRASVQGEFSALSLSSVQRTPLVLHGSTAWWLHAGFR